MNRLYRKILIMIGICISSIIIILIILTLSIQFFFRDKLINYVIEQLNAQVDARITIKDADFTLWRTFPAVSVQCNNVFIESSNTFKNEIKTNTDTLLVSDKINFEFNLLKLLAKKYVLRRIHIDKGYFNLVTDKINISNFNILKPSKDSISGSEINLKKLLITNSIIKYRHVKSDVSISVRAKKGMISGTINKKLTKLLIKSDLFVEYVNVKGENYVRGKFVKSDLPIEIVDNLLYRFKPSYVIVSEMPVMFSGEYSGKPLTNIRFSFNAKEIELSDVFENLPEGIEKKITGYKADGKLNLNMTIAGIVDDKHLPKINCSFSVSEATITEIKSKIKLNGFNLEGIYSNGSNNNSQTSYIKINKLLSKIGSGEFSLNGKIESFTTPKIQLSCITLLNINDIKQFFRLDSVEVLEGKAESSFTISGVIDKLDDFKLSDAKNLNFVGQVNIHNASFKMVGSNYPFTNINGLVKFSNDLYFDNVSFMLHETDIQLNGKMEQGISYFLGNNQKTIIDAELTSRSIDLSNYFVSGKTSENSEYSREMLFPQNILFDLKLNVNEFKLNKFNAKRIRGNLSYKPGMFILKALSFETCEGQISGNGAIIQDIHNNFLVKASSDVKRLNINQLFVTFNDFGQKILKSKHINGKVSGKVNFTAVWNNHLNLLTDQLIVDSDVTINNGELVNFEPLYGLSKFIALDELKNVKFSTLHNNILIKDKQIIIPQMDIQSSAFNISGSGLHQFDNHYDYKVRVLLSEVLYGKAKKAKKENEEYGQVEDDGLGKTSLYLSIVGFGNTYKISYDSRKTIDVVKDNLKKQKDELKSIFKEEYGWFKNDSLSNNKKTSTRKPGIEWEEESNSSSSSGNKKDKKTESEGKLKVEFE